MRVLSDANSSLTKKRCLVREPEDSDKTVAVSKRQTVKSLGGSTSNLGNIGKMGWNTRLQQLRSNYENQTLNDDGEESASHSSLPGSSASG